MIAEILRPERSKIRKSFLSRKPASTIWLISLLQLPPVCFALNPMAFNAASVRSHPLGTSSCCLSRYFFRVCAHSPLNPILFQLLLWCGFIPGTSTRHHLLGIEHSRCSLCRYTRPKRFRVAKPRLIGSALRSPSPQCSQDIR